jgi:hypothetical protein
VNPDLLRRRGGTRNKRGRDADKRAGRSSTGIALACHLKAGAASDIDTLYLDLDPHRRHVAMLDLTADELTERLRRHAACLPDELYLYVRFSRKYDCPLTPAQLSDLRPRVVFGSPERDIGRYPLIQIGVMAAVGNRVRIGRATALVRAALASVQVARNFIGGEKQ